MESKNIIIPIEKDQINVKIISFLDKVNLLDSKNELLEEICSEIKNLNQKGNFGGSVNEEEFRSELLRFSFDEKEKKEEYDSKKIKLDQIVNNTKEAINKVKTILGKKDIIIYIFPTNDRFTIKELGGVSGLLAWDNIIHIYVNPVSNWELNYKSTILHELAHCLQDYYTYNMDLSDHLIADGLAEHFQEKYLYGNRSQFTKIISKEEAKKIFKELKPVINKTIKEDMNLHMELFFGGEKYATSTGYTIGYYIIEDYLKKLNKIDWKKILSTNPKEILKESGWLSYSQQTINLKNKEIKK